MRIFQIIQIWIQMIPKFMVQKKPKKELQESSGIQMQEFSYIFAPYW